MEIRKTEIINNNDSNDYSIIIKTKIVWLIIFSMAMAFLEAAVVVYLRKLYYASDILNIFPIKAFELNIFLVELGRELATIFMILAIAVLTTNKKKNRVINIFACFVFVFGIWDVFYYIWLKVAIAWPVSWLEWDILFLIPWVWFGPWICPVIISVLFIAWGGFILTSQKTYKFSAITLLLFIIGIVVCLVSFLEPALSVLLEHGQDGFFSYIPSKFLWWIYILGVLLMIIGLWGIVFKRKE